MADNRHDEAIDLVARQELLELIGGDDVIADHIEQELDALNDDYKNAVEERVLELVERHIFVDEVRAEAAYEYLVREQEEE